jgi:transcription elongation factor Elf1
MTNVIPFKKYDHEYGACRECDHEKFFVVLTDDEEDYEILAVECAYCGQSVLVRDDNEIVFEPEF